MPYYNQPFYGHSIGNSSSTAFKFLRFIIDGEAYMSIEPLKRILPARYYEALLNINSPDITPYVIDNDILNVYLRRHPTIATALRNFIPVYEVTTTLINELQNMTGIEYGEDFRTTQEGRLIFDIICTIDNALLKFHAHELSRKQVEALKEKVHIFESQRTNQADSPDTGKEQLPEIFQFIDELKGFFAQFDREEGPSEFLRFARELRHRFSDLMPDEELRQEETSAPHSSNAPTNAQEKNTSTRETALPDLGEDPTADFLTVKDFITQHLRLDYNEATANAYSAMLADFYRRTRGHSPLRKRDENKRDYNCYHTADLPLLHFVWKLFSARG